ncbi:DUF1996 domain-containing protein [Blastococcus sp. CT_GayMR19]|uniref:DUF1996 domain-containing protein n=1 Tax=Blastococcus sp. CT_GayMR19 TaxID=2559608 RepID=UPI0014304539|nr:DUF1996 domain-containing protein [Blastococcus sp. CT_GayMR19]
MAALAATVFGVLTILDGTNNPASADGFRILSPSASDFPQHVDWVTTCQVTKNAPDDPIVFPGMPGRAHDHTFSGNTSINAYSTAEQLVNQRTNCTNSGDTASYWMPTLLVDGKPLNPYQVRAYYRAATRDTSKLVAIPFGLKILAGDAMATSPQSAGIAGFQCRIEGEGATVRKQSLPPNCGPRALLEASVVFPNCWDGKNLDSADHKSHMSYAKDFKCDAAHPVQIPQLTLAERFTKGRTGGKITLASMNSPMTLHADFLNAWKPAAMAELMKHCIYAHRFCETVSDSRMPPGMKTTVPSGSAAAPRPTATAAPAPTKSPSATASSSAPAITPAQRSGTRLAVDGARFPAHVSAKVVVSFGGSKRSAVVEAGHDGTFSASLSIPGSWSGSAEVSVTANAGKLSARNTVELR